MRAVWVRVRADLRTRWVSWLALALAIGIGGAVVLTAAAGARRTETAFPRFLEQSRAEDVLINVGPPGEPDQKRFEKLVRGFPQVESTALIAPMLVVPPDRSLHTPYHYAGIDRRYGNAVNRPNIVEGRRPRADRTNEVLINRAMADEHGFEVGDVINWRAHSVQEDSDDFLSKESKPLHLRVVGIGVYPNEVVPTAPYDALPFIYLTPAFFERHQENAHVYGFFAIRLRNGEADAAGFRKVLYETLQEFGASPQTLPMSMRFDRNAEVQRAIQPQAVALWIFAALTGAALLLVIIQVLARQILLDSDEYRELQALGMSRRQLFAGAMARVAVVAVVGAAVAVIGAALASPLLPIGSARLAEPNPGFAVNAAILGIGCAAIVVLVVVLAAIPAWRAASVVGARARASRRVAHDRASRLSEAVASAGVPATPAIGIRNAVQPGQGRSRVPVRSAIIVNGVAIALVVAALSFTANLNRLAETPRLYGWDWTFKMGIGDTGIDDVGDTMARLRRDPAVEAIALANYGSARIAGREVAAVGIESRRGVVAPTLLEGREAVRDDEIVLGTRTLRHAGRSVGDTVRVSDIFVGTGSDCDGEKCPGLKSREMRIVGRAIFPKLGDASHSPTNLGEGAATTANVFTYPGRPDEKYTVVLIRLKPGVDVAAARARLNPPFAPDYFCGGEPICLRAAERPGDISSLSQIRGTTLLLAGALTFLAFGLLAHVLLSSVRRRSRDLAVLKTLGFMRRQISAITAWEATTIAVLALLIGIPAGLAAGSIVWRVVADQLGVAPGVHVPVVALLAVIPATVLLANLIAAVPARLAARTHPATVLRSE